MIKLASIGEAAKYLGISTQTLRRWERTGKIPPANRTIGDQRRYDLGKLCPQAFQLEKSKDKTIGYARVSSFDQKADLERQEKMLELYCAARGWSFELISDLGSGMNYQKRGLKKLIRAILEQKISRIVLTHKDRLLRFGAELIFSLCEMRSVEIVIINKGSEPNFLF
jgi:putative resolvase